MQEKVNISRINCSANGTFLHIYRLCPGSGFVSLHKNPTLTIRIRIHGSRSASLFKTHKNSAFAYRNFTLQTIAANPESFAAAPDPYKGIMQK